MDVFSDFIEIVLGELLLKRRSQPGLDQIRRDADSSVLLDAGKTLLITLFYEGIFTLTFFGKQLLIVKPHSSVQIVTVVQSKVITDKSLKRLR